MGRPARALLTFRERYQKSLGTKFGFFLSVDAVVTY